MTPPPRSRPRRVSAVPPRLPMVAADEAELDEAFLAQRDRPPGATASSGTRSSSRGEHQPLPRTDVSIQELQLLGGGDPACNDLT